MVRRDLNQFLEPSVPLVLCDRIAARRHFSSRPSLHPVPPNSLFSCSLDCLPDVLNVSCSLYLTLNPRVNATVAPSNRDLPAGVSSLTSLFLVLSFLCL